MSTSLRKMYLTDMLSGPICAMVWQGRDAVKTGRSMFFSPARPHFISPRIYKTTDPLTPPAKLCLARPTLWPPPRARSAATMPSMWDATSVMALMQWRARRRKSRCGLPRGRCWSGRRRIRNGSMKNPRNPSLGDARAHDKRLIVVVGGSKSYYDQGQKRVIETIMKIDLYDDPEAGAKSPLYLYLFLQGAKRTNFFSSTS